MNTYKVKLACRKDIEDNWINDNPTLIHGELGVATHDIGGIQVVKGIKVGEGLEWIDTPYTSLVDVDSVVSTVMNSFGDSPSVNFYYDSADGLYKFEVISEGIDHVTEVTHAEILAKINAGELIISSFYRITDYQTVHMIPYTDVAPSTPVINTGPIEPLVIQAININALSSVAQSAAFPNDVLYYNVMDVLCEDGITARKGNVTYRKDTVKNLETYYDFRNVKFRRWKLNPPAWAAGSYARGAAVMGSDNRIYASKHAANTVPPPVNDDGWGGDISGFAVIANPDWERIFVDNDKCDFYLATKPDSIAIGVSNIPVLASDFRDFYTFNTTITGEIGAITGINIGAHTTYNNIIFRANYLPSWYGKPANGETVINNIFANGCYDMTFTGAYNMNNVFGQGSNGSIILGLFTGNNVGSYYNNNLHILITGEYFWSFDSNTISTGIHNNIIGPDSNFNMFAGDFNGNIISYGMTRNEFYTQTINNNIGLELRDNIFKKVQDCTIGARSQQNIIEGGQFAGGLLNTIVGDDFMWNEIRYVNGGTFGNAIQYNIIKANQNNLKLPNNFQYNKINGIIAAGTYFAIGSNRNTFNNDFGGGTQAIPLNLISCVFNQPVSGLTTNAGITLTRVVFNSAITTKNILANQSDVTVNASPDGSLWTSSIDDTGHLTTEKIV